MYVGNRVTRFGNILPFELLFQGTGKYFEKIWFVVGLLIVQKWFDVDVSDFQIEL